MNRRIPTGLLLVSFATTVLASSLPDSPIWEARSYQAGSQAGWALASGDFNGDGRADLAVGAPESGVDGYYPPIAPAGEGRVDIYYGSAAGLSTVPALTLHGTTVGGQFGSALACAGDVDNNNADDLVVGAPAVMDEAGTGRVYLFRGTPAGLSGTPATTIAGPNFDDGYGGLYGTGFGRTLAPAGDVDKDGFDDVLVGAPDLPVLWYYGKVFLFAGSAAGLSASATWEIGSDQLVDEEGYAPYGLGSSLASGDMNGDGWRDLLVGAPSFNYYSDAKDLSSAHLFAGGASGYSVVPAWSGNSGVVGSTTAYGIALAVGDVNDDGKDDFAVGASYVNSYNGAAYLYHGAATMGLITTHWTREGSAYQYGMALSIGDLNNDGFADLAVGAGGSGIGVHLGSATGLGLEDWSTQAVSGSPLLILRDVTGDGHGDLLAGDPHFMSNVEDYTTIDEGRVMVFGSLAPETPGDGGGPGNGTSGSSTSSSSGGCGGSATGASAGLLLVVAAFLAFRC